MSTREAARWLLGEMQAEVDALPYPDPAAVEAVVRAATRRGSPTVVSQMASLAGVPLLSRELEHAGPGLVSRLVSLEQRRVRAKAEA